MARTFDNIDLNATIDWMILEKLLRDDRLIVEFDVHIASLTGFPIIDDPYTSRQLAHAFKEHLDVPTWGALKARIETYREEVYQFTRILNDAPNRPMLYGSGSYDPTKVHPRDYKSREGAYYRGTALRHLCYFLAAQLYPSETAAQDFVRFNGVVSSLNANPFNPFLAQRSDMGDLKSLIRQAYETCLRSTSI